MADHFSQRLQRAFKGKYECTGIPGALLYKERENFHKIRRTNTEKTSYFGNLAGMRWAAFFSTKRGGADQKENFSGRGKKCAARGKWVFHQRKFSFSNGISLINMFLNES